MTTVLDIIRYNSGIAGEEVADMVDSLEREVSSLREQVEKLTKERNAFQDQCIRLKNERVVENGQLAALASQNEKMRDAFERIDNGIQWARKPLSGKHGETADQVANLAKQMSRLPNLATPVLNRIRAEGMRMASTFISLVRNDWASAGDNLSVQAAEYLISALDTRADEL